MQREINDTRSGYTLSVCIAKSRDDAVTQRGVHPDLAVHAARSTMRGLRHELSARPLGCADRQRVQSYYDAVLRRTAFGRPLARDTAFRERVRVASLVADLSAVDAGEERIRTEVQAFFGPQSLQYLPLKMRVS